MIGISDTGRDIVSHIDLLPPFSSFHIGIIILHELWSTIVGNEFLQIVTDLDLGDHAIYSSLFGGLPKKPLAQFFPISLCHKKRGYQLCITFGFNGG